jgi:hypothetical protein
MAKATKAAGRSGAYVLGRGNFAKISAVESIRLSRRSDDDFKDFDRRGLSANERRRALAKRFGGKH